MTEPKTRGLTFTAQNVLAIMDDRKTQSRRLGHQYDKWKKGDVFYVRETWAWYPAEYDISNVMYKATTKDFYEAQFKELFERWRPSIHMPRWAARTYCVLTENVYREPLQDISEADVRAEGIIHNPQFGDAVDAYACLWESINGAGSWAENPSVAIIKFKRIKDDN